MNPPKKSTTPQHPAFIDQITPDFAPLDASQLSPTVAQEDGLVGHDQVLGSSKWDPQFTPLGYDLQEHRAHHQSFLDKAGNGVAKAVGNGVGMVGTIGGLAWGAGKAMATGDIRDIAHNELAEKVEDYSNWLQETFPHYETKKEKEANFLSADNLLTWNQLWGGVVSNLGFSFGAGMLTKGVTKTLAGAIGRMALGGAEGLEALAAAKGVGEGSALINHLTSLARSTKFVNATSVLGGSLVAGAVEAQQESQQNYTQTYQAQVDQFHQDFPGVELPEFKKREFEDRASSSSLSTYLLNTALLSHDNFLQFGKSLMGGYKQALKKEATTGIGKVLQSGSKWAGRAGILFSPSEGIEEGTQNFIQAASTDYFSRKKDNKAWGDINDLVLATTKGLHEALETKEGKNAILTGGLSGGPSVAVHNILAGQGTGWNQQAQEIEHTNKVLSDLEALRQQNPLFAAQHDNVVRHTSYMNSMKEAVANGDIYQYENLRADALKSRVQYHTQTGTLSKLQDELDTVGKMPNEEFQKMFGLDEQDFTGKDVKAYVGQLQKEVKRLSSSWNNIDTRFPGASQIQKESLYDVLTNIGNRDEREQQLNAQIFQQTNIDFTVWQGLNPQAPVEEYAQAVVKALRDNPGTGEVGPQDVADFLRLRDERHQLVDTYQDLLSGKLAEVVEPAPSEMEGPQTVEAKPTPSQQPQSTSNGNPRQSVIPTSESDELPGVESGESEAPTPVGEPVAPTKKAQVTPTPSPVATPTQSTSLADLAQVIATHGEKSHKLVSGSEEDYDSIPFTPTQRAAFMDLFTGEDKGPERASLRKLIKAQGEAPAPTAAQSPSPVAESPAEYSKQAQGTSVDPTYYTKSVTHLTDHKREGFDPRTYPYSKQGEAKFHTLHNLTLPSIRTGQVNLQGSQFYVKAETPSLPTAQHPLHFNLYTTLNGKETFLGFLQQGDKKGETVEQQEANTTAKALLEKVKKQAELTPNQPINVSVEVSASLDSLPAGVVGEPLSVLREGNQNKLLGGNYTILRQRRSGSEYTREISYLSGEKTGTYPTAKFLKDFGKDAPSDGFLLVVPTLDGKGQKLVGLSPSPASEQTFQALTTQLGKNLSGKAAGKGLQEIAFLAANPQTSLGNLHLQFGHLNGSPVVEVYQYANGQSTNLGVLNVDSSKPLTSQEQFLKALSPSQSLKESLKGSGLKVKDLFADTPVRQEPGTNPNPSSFTLSTTPEVWGPVYFNITGLDIPVTSPVSTKGEVSTSTEQEGKSEQAPTPIPQEDLAAKKARREAERKAREQAREKQQDIAFKMRVEGEAKSTDLVNRNLPLFRKQLAGILPKGFYVQGLEDLASGRFSDGKTYGAFVNQVIYLHSKLPKGTQYHEAFHAAWRYLVDPTTRGKAAREMASLMGEHLSLAGLQAYRETYSGRYDHLSNQELADLMVEEALADAFQGYMNKRSGVKGILRKAFDRIRDFFNLIRGRKGEEVATLFAALERGKYLSVQPSLQSQGMAPVWALPIQLATAAKSKELVGKLFDQYINRYQYYEGEPKERFAQMVEALRREESVLDTEGKADDQDYLTSHKLEVDYDEETGEDYLVDAALMASAIPLLWKEVSANLRTLNFKLTQSGLEVAKEDLDRQDELNEQDEEQEDEDKGPDIRFDQNSWSLTGVGSLSQQIRSFLSLLATDIPGSNFRLPANVFGTFSLLQRNLKGLDTFQQMYERVHLLSQSDPTGVLTDLVGKLDGKLTGKEADQFFINKFTRTFKTEALSSLFTELDQDKGTTRVYSPNRNKEQDMLLNRWNNQYNTLVGKRTDFPVVAKAVGNYLNQVEALVGENHVFSPEEVLNLSQGIATIGVDLSPGFLSQVLTGKEPNMDFPKLKQDLGYTLQHLSQGRNPFTDSKSRLLGLAERDVLNRADIYQASYQNAEGETIFGHSAPAFEYVRARQLQDGTHGLDLQDDYLKHNYLVQHFQGEGGKIVGDRNGLLQLAGGLREKSQELGVTPKAMDPRTQIISDSALYTHHKGFRWAVHEAKATTTLAVLGKDVSLPKFAHEGQLTPEGKQALLDMAAQDKARIGKVWRELYGQAGKEKLPADQLVGGYHFLEKAPKSAPKDLPTLPGGFNKQGIPQVPSEELVKQYIKTGHRNLLPTGLQYSQLPDLNLFTHTPTSEELDSFTEGFLELATASFQAKLEENELGDWEHMKLLAGEAWVQDHKNFPEEAMRDWKQNFLLHDLVLSNAMSQLVIGEQAYYLNPTNLTKRMAGVVAAGQDLGEGKFAAMTLADEDYTIEASTFGEGTQTKFVGEKGNGTDAQSYISPTRFQLIKQRLGYSNRETDTLVGKLIAGEKLAPREVDKLMNDLTANPIKGVYFDGQTYIKTSYFPLFKELTSELEDGVWKPLPGRQKLHHLREILEGEEGGLPSESLPKVDELHRVSASKLQRKGVNFPKADGTYDRTSLSSQVLENKYWRLQVENPSGKTKITQGTQLLQLLDSEMEDSHPVEYQGREATVGEVRKAYQGAMAQHKVNAFQKASAMLDKVVKGDSVYLEMMQNLLRDSGASQNTVEFFTQENGKPKYSLDLPFVEKQVEKAFLSFFNKQVFQQKVPGMKLTLVSSSGFQVQDKETGKYRDLLPHRMEGGEWVEEATSARELPIKELMTLYRKKVKEYVTSRGGTVSNVLPKGEFREFKDLVTALHFGLPKAEGMSDFGNTDLQGETTFEQRQTNDNLLKEALQVVLRDFEKDREYFTKRVYKGGKVVPAEVILSEELLVKKGLTREEYESLPEEQKQQVVTMLGFRIPTQSHHSMMPFTVVDWVPAYYGSMVVAPKEITWLSGADYDVDSLFVNRKEFRVLRGANKEFLGVSFPGQASTPQEEYQNWQDYYTKEDTFYKYLKGKGLSQEEAFTTMGLPLTQEGYEALEEGKKGTWASLSNTRFEAEKSFLLNPANSESLFTPATIDSLKFLKGFANAQYKVQEDSSLPYYLYGPRHLQWQSTTTGKANVGGAANAGKTHAFVAKNGVELSTPLTFSSIEATGFHHLDQGDVNLTKGKDGKWILGENLAPSRVADQLSTMTSGMTDDAKERLSFALNLTPQTLPVFEYGISLGLGINRVLGLFATQPILKELAYRYQQAEAQVKEKGVSSFELTQKLLRELEAKVGEVNTQGSDAELLEVLQDAPGNLLKLQVLTRDGIAPLEDLPFLTQQTRVLKAYLQLEEQAKYFGYVNKLLNSNKGLPVSVQEAKDYFITPYEALLGDKRPFSVGDALHREDNILTNLKLILPTKTNVGKSVLDLTQNHFLVDSPLFNSLKSTFQALGGRNSQMEDFQEGFLTHLTMLVENQQLVNSTGKQLSEYQYLLSDPTRNITTVLDTLLSQEELKGNLFLNQLVPKAPDDLKENKFGNPFYRLEYNTRAKNEADFVDQLSNEWLDLYLNPNPVVKQAALELKAYLAIKDSYQFKSGSYIGLAKPQLFTRISNGVEENGKQVVGLKQVADLARGADPQKGLLQLERALGFPDTDFYENPNSSKPAGELVLDFFRKWYSVKENLQGLGSWYGKYDQSIGSLKPSREHKGYQEAFRTKDGGTPFPLVMMTNKNPYLLVSKRGDQALYQPIKVDEQAKYQSPWGKGISQQTTLPQEVETPQQEEPIREESGAPTIEDSLPFTSPDFIQSLNSQASESDLTC